MKSTAQKIAQLEGLLGTRDLTAWETGFVSDMVDKLNEANGRPIDLTARQLTMIDRIYDKHFAG